MKSSSTKKTFNDAITSKLEVELAQLQTNAASINAVRSKLYHLMLNAYQVPQDHVLRINPKLNLNCTELESLLNHHGFYNSKQLNFH